MGERVKENWYLEGFKTAASYWQIYPEGNLRREIIKAQLRWLLNEADPIEGGFAQGLADGLTSAFGA